MSIKKKIQNDSALEVKWALLCKNASVDQQSNNVSLFNIIEELTINKSPLGDSIVKRSASFPEKVQINSEFTLVVHMERKPEIKIKDFEPSMELKFTDPQGVNFATIAEIPIKLKEGKNRLRNIISIGSLFVKTPGVYNLIVSTRNTKSDTFSEGARVPLDVKIYE